MTALIKNMYEIEVGPGGKKVMVVGEMLELGDDAEKYHQEIGELIGNSYPDVVWFIGPSHVAFETGLKSFGWDKVFRSSAKFDEKIADEVGAMLYPHDLVFIKGSRGMKLENVVKRWLPGFKKT
jgi:UDP-N-acetylmuramoyl-tripeptide--D-alanyl-D-alanine ligase